MRKRHLQKQVLLPQIFAATLILLFILSVSLIGVAYSIRENIRQSCFEQLEDAASETTYSLRVIAEKNTQHLTSLASLISTQEDIHSPLVLTVLESFDNKEEMSDIGVLYPDNQVLFSDGSYGDASDVLSFEKESALGAHISGKSVSLRNPDKAVLRQFVTVKRDGKIIAMLYGIIDIAEIADLFKVNVYDGNAQLYLADVDTGEIFMDTYHTALGTLDMLRQRKMTDGYDFNTIMADVKSGKSGNFVSVSQSTGDLFIATYQPAGINNWYAMLTVPEPIVMKQAAKPTSLLMRLAVIYAATFMAYGFVVSKIYRRFINMFANTPAGICVLGADEKLSILQANKEFYRIMMLDKTDKKDIPDNLLDMLRDDDKKTILEKYHEIVSGNQPTNDLELQVTDPLGKEHYILATAFYDKKDTKHITVNMLDITERKRMERELLLLDQEYRIAIQMTKRHVVFYDIERRTARLLPGLESLLNLPDEIEDFPQALLEQKLLDEGSTDAYTELFNALLEGEESGSAYLQFRKTNQTEYRWYKIEFFSIYDDNKKPSYAIVSLEDAEEEHENELAYRRLQQSSKETPEEEYKSYERNLTKDTVDSEHGKAFVSPESVLVGSPEERIHFLITERVCPEYQEALTNFISRIRLIDAFRHGQTSDYMEIKIIREENPLWFGVKIQLIEDSYSGDIKAYYLFLNIDEQKKLELQTKLDMDTLKTELENSRIRIMMNQMQPHFLYNALSAIQTIIKVDPNYAYQLIGDFTVHLRSSIRSLQNDTPIPFTEELKNIKAYLNIEKMRMGDRLNCAYDIQSENFKVVPLSIQPLAENAARHGIYPFGEKGGTVTIRSYETEEAYIVEVTDNGAGFDVNKIFSNQSDSVGLKNLIFRLKKLMNAEVSIHSEIGSGTTVTVTLPKERKKKS